MAEFLALAAQVAFATTVTGVLLALVAALAVASDRAARRREEARTARKEEGRG